MRYFKVIRGFGQEDFIPIDETELERALYAQMTGNSVLILKNGSVMGNHISAIMPDFHRAMGWNYAHRMGPEDHDEIHRSGAAQAHSGAIGEAKERIRYFLSIGQEALIGSAAPVPLSDKPMLSGEVDALVKKLTV